MPCSSVTATSSRGWCAFAWIPRFADASTSTTWCKRCFLEATSRFAKYASNDPMPFLLWLRFLGAHKKSCSSTGATSGAQARDVGREQHDNPTRPLADTAFLADQISGHVTSPSAAAVREETSERLREALDDMASDDREVLVLRHYEQLTSAEVARELGLDASAASKRYIRALRRLQETLRTLDPSEHDSRP